MRASRYSPDYLDPQWGQFDAPVATFPGDGDQMESYAETMRYDPKGRGYPYMVVNGLARITRSHGGIIDAETYERLKRMAIAPEAADYYIDASGRDPDERSRRFDLVTRTTRHELNSGADPDAHRSLMDEAPLLTAALRYFGNSVHVLPEIVRSKIKEHAFGTLIASRQKTKAPDVVAYSTATLREGTEYGSMWAYTAWAAQRELPPTDFTSWLAKLVSAMTLADAAADLREDYEAGNIMFKPSFAGRARLAKMAIANRPPNISSVFRWLISSETP